MEDIVDDVNALLKLGVGDPYRLEHIKLAFVENKILWDSDKKYLERMKEKYLTKIHTEEEIDDAPVEDDSRTIHCWKCGKKNLLRANFCMICGATLFDVGSKPGDSIQQPNAESGKKFNMKIPILIIIPVVILAILGAGYTQGYFDGIFESSTEPKTTGPTNSKCGEGTIFDAATNACVLPGTESSESKTTTQTNSKCGEGTIFDAATNSCILDG